MTITREFLFNGAYEGAWYPGFPGGSDASAGKDGGGVHALVRGLEQALGITAPAPAHLDRIVAARTGVRAYLSDHPGVYFAESFSIDDLAVSRLLLAVRDELLMGGWNGSAAQLQGRPALAVESLGACAEDRDLRGLPDRILAAIAALEARGTRVYHAICCARGAENEPVLVRRLLEALAHTGTAVGVLPGAEAGSVKSPGDLAGARAKVMSGAGFSPRGDGSLVLIEGANACDAAEALASWLRTDPPENAVIIADEAGRAGLNAALGRYGLPTIGAESVSPYRSALQTLGLVFTLQWRPFDPARLLEFLQLPLSPIPRRAGLHLAGTLAGTPGIGNEKWRAAVAECVSGEEDEARRRKLRERLAFWLPEEENLIDAGEAMPTARIHVICSALADWARTRARAMMKQDDGRDRGDAETSRLLDAVSAQAERLSALLERYGSGSISHVRLMDLLDRVSGSGAGISICRAEEGSLFSVDSPSALLGPADTVIWWNFTRQGADVPPQKLFSDSERAVLAAAGIAIAGPGERAIAEAREWRRPLECAQKRLVLVAPETDLGEAQARHPIWDEISSGMSTAEKGAVTVRTAELLLSRTGPLKVRSSKVAALGLPPARRVFHLKNVRPALRDRESASSLESLAGCPLRYVLQYQAGLRPAGAVSISNNVVVRGNVGHRIIQEVFAPGRMPASAGEAERLAAETLERLVAAEAAPLSLPGLEAELADFRHSMVRAAGAFWKLLYEQCLSVAGVEEEISASTEIGTVGGYVDLLLRDGKGRPLILDMKYSDRGEGSYVSRIADDRAVQLAVYSRSAGESAPAAYLSLKDAMFSTPSGNGFPGARPVGGSSLAETWDMLTVTVGHILKNQFKKKTVVAAGVDEGDGSGVPDLPEKGLALDPPCGYCDYSALCGRAWAEGGGER